MVKTQNDNQMGKMRTRVSRNKRKKMFEEKEHLFQVQVVSGGK